MVKVAVLSMIFLPAAALAATLQTGAIDNSRSLDKEMNSISQEITDTEACFVRVEAIRNELAAKKAKLSAEFKGSIPVAFAEMISIKSAREVKTKTRCVEKDAALSKRIADLYQTMSTMYPPSPNIKAQRARAHELKKRQLAAMEKVLPRKGGKPPEPARSRNAAPESSEQ
jgi:capsule polysaccharide export protein KpsE/RkpR